MNRFPRFDPASWLLGARADNRDLPTSDSSRDAGTSGADGQSGQPHGPLADPPAPDAAVGPVTGPAALEDWVMAPLRQRR